MPGFAPAAILALGWIVFVATQIEWQRRRPGLATGGGGGLARFASDLAFGSVGAGYPGHSHGWLPGIIGWSAGWLALAVLGSLSRLSSPGGEEPFSALRPWLVALCWGTPLLMVVLSPIAWLGRGKFLFLLHWPLALLACAGLGRLASRIGGRRLGAVLAGVVLLMLAGSTARQARDLRGGSPPLGRLHRPLAWRCADPWIPGAILAPEAHGGLLPSTPRRAGLPDWLRETLGNPDGSGRAADPVTAPRGGGGGPPRSAARPRRRTRRQ